MIDGVFENEFAKTRSRNNDCVVDVSLLGVEEKTDIDGKRKRERACGHSGFDVISAVSSFNTII